MVAVAGAVPGSVAEVAAMVDRAAGAIAGAGVDAVVVDVAAGAAVDACGTERGVVKVNFTVHRVSISAHRSTQIRTDKKKRFRNGDSGTQVKGGFVLSVQICENLWESFSSQAVEALS